MGEGKGEKGVVEPHSLGPGLVEPWSVEMGKATGEQIGGKMLGLGPVDF